jgi:hypothetical protein
VRIGRRSLSTTSHNCTVPQSITSSPSLIASSFHALSIIVRPVSDPSTSGVRRSALTATRFTPLSPTLPFLDLKNDNQPLSLESRSQFVTAGLHFFHSPFFFADSSSCTDQFVLQLWTYLDYLLSCPHKSSPRLDGIESLGEEAESSSV